MSYTQLTQEQRYQISALLKMDHNQTEISEVIGTHKSTVCRELGRNCGQRGYRPKQAHHKALCRCALTTNPNYQTILFPQDNWEQLFVLTKLL